MKDNILHCSRCYHAWYPRKNKNPLYCPKCKSPYWNKERRKTKKEDIDMMIKIVCDLHNEIIKETGGEKGIRDKGGIYASTHKILKKIERNPGKPIKIGSSVLEEFAKRHYFIDGNKRTAYALSKIFMLSLRCHLETKYQEALPFMLDVAKYNSEINEAEIRDWLNKKCRIIDKKDIEIYLNKTLVDLMINSENNENGQEE